MFSKKLFQVLLLLLCCEYCVNGESLFELVEVKHPERVSPGEKIKVEYKLKAVRLEGPSLYRPEGVLIWKDSGIQQTIRGDDVAPWKVEDIKDGDEFNVVLNMVIDGKVRSGDMGTLAFGMWRKKDAVYDFVTIGKGDRVKTEIHCAQKTQMTLAGGKERFPLVVIPRIKAPEIDGKALPGEWDKAVETSAFVSSLDNKPYVPKTTVRLGYDDECLYIRFVTEEKEEYVLAANRFELHDSALWRNDAAEMYLQPSLRDSDYFQFICDTLGQRFDAYNTDYAGYNPFWRAAATRAAGKVTYEAAIPFSAIMREKVHEGMVWRGDFFRYREKGSSLSAWSSTLGGHDQIGRYGYLVFGSAKKALLEKFGMAHDKTARKLASVDGDLKELLKGFDNLEKEVRQRDEAYAAAEFQGYFEVLSKMSERMEKQLFAAKYKASGAPIIIQSVEAYSIKAPVSTSAELLTGLKASFLADETRLFAFNITNISKDVHHLRFSLRYGETTGIDHKSFDFLLLGVPNFRVKWRNVLPVATKDGTPSYDALPENEAGVYTIAPEQCEQVILEMTPENAKQTTNAKLVIESIDGKDFATQELPVTLTVFPKRLMEAPDQPMSFGFDYMTLPICKEMPSYGEKHYGMMREFGFNYCFISGLRHLPRPKADKEGNLIGEMDFSNLEQLLRIVGKRFDGYYLDIAVMEKKVQRKDLFGIDVNEPAFEKPFKTWLGKIIEKCESLGITSEKLLICPYDENMGPIALRLARWIKEVSPKSQIIMDTATTKMEELVPYDNLVDVWMPHLRTLNQEGYRLYYEHILKLNKPVMTYYYTSGNSEKLKSPYSDFALNFWICYQLNLRGMGYWAAGQYYGDPWHRKNYPGNYDTSLLYPAEGGPIPSKRLFGWKRGFQDFQLLKLAEQKLLANGDKETAAELRRNVEMVISYPNEPQRSEIVREYCRKLFQ